MTLPAKNRLRATKVDRIAIVDRPAVPDAQIVLYKRKPDEAIEAEKALVDFDREFVYRATGSAVETLENGFYRVLYLADAGDRQKEWKSLFKSFKHVIIDVIVPLVPEEKQEKQDAQARPTVEDIVGGFQRGISLTAISESFGYFKSQMGYLILSVKQLPKGKSAVSKVIDVFEEHIFGLTEGVFEKYKDQMTVEKIGRVISSARLAKLRQALAVISEIIADADAKEKTGKGKEEDQMEIQDILKALAESDLFKNLTAKLESIEGVLKEKGLLLTDAEKAKLAEKQKKDAEDAEKAKKDADLKAKNDADARDKAEKVAKEKADKDAEVEKKQKEDAEARLKKIEEGVTAVTKVATEISKRMGLKTSLDAEGSEKGLEKDVFGDTVRGTK